MEDEALRKGALGPFAPAFLAGELRAQPFLQPDYARPAARAARARAAAERPVPAALAGALVRQSRALPPSAARDAHLALLARPGACAVVTGQQVGLFLGPLYTLYKAATAIAVARALAEECGVPCVPVFWLQTEDHDLAEVDHCHLLDAGGGLVRLGLARGEGDPHLPVRDRVLGAEVEGLAAALAEALGDAPRAAEVVAAVRAHYRPGATLAAAFSGLLASVFAEEGLVLLDPRDPELARATAGVHLQALEEAAAISHELLERQQALARAGFEAQVHVREGAPLAFFHPDGPAGPRYRLSPHPGGWALVGREQVVSRQALLDAVASEPLALSSSALLRPIIQDTLLPTAAVVGGPGEANYFAQLEPLAARFRLPVPMFVPRNRFRLLDPRTRRWLDQLGLSAAEAEAPREALLARLAGGVGEAAGRPAALEAALVAQLDEALARLGPGAGEGLDDALRRTRGTVARAASRLAGRWRRSLEGADQVTGDRVERLQRVLWPHGEPQERVLGPLSFAARTGLEGLKREVFAALTPYAPTSKDVLL